MKTIKTKGFSLVEILTVLAIMAIMATMGSYSYTRYVNNTNLRTAARQLSNDMMFAKQSAITQTLCYCMTITTGTPGQYTIEMESSGVCGSSATSTITKKPTDIGPKVTGLNIYSTDITGNNIYFQPRGIVTIGTAGASTGSVVLRNTRNSTATITINITGKTYVKYNMQ